MTWKFRSLAYYNNLQKQLEQNYSKQLEIRPTLPTDLLEKFDPEQFSKAEAVFTAEKALYQKIYDAYAEEYKNSPNPCRDFKF